MAEQKLSAEQKSLETDLWIIALVTPGVFLGYAAMGERLTAFVRDSGICVAPRLLLNAAVRFGLAGLGATFIAIYGMLMVRKKTGNARGCVFAFCFIRNAI